MECMWKETFVACFTYIRRLWLIIVLQKPKKHTNTFSKGNQAPDRKSKADPAEYKSQVLTTGAQYSKAS
jgi:hypothetical protein